MLAKPVVFFKQVWEELAKVTWPTRNEAIRMTLTVIAVSAVVAAFIGGLDFVLTSFITRVVSNT